MFDTNICIHLIQGQPTALIRRCEAMAHGDVVISSLVLAELRHGVERFGSNTASRAVAGNALAVMLDFLPVVNFDARAATAYGVLCAANPDRKRDAVDTFIAAHAISLGLRLVTNNLADFRPYEGLSVESWV